jgi:hypothetical protein
MSAREVAEALAMLRFTNASMRRTVALDCEVRDFLVATLQAAALRHLTAIQHVDCARRGRAEARSCNDPRRRTRSLEADLVERAAQPRLNAK